MSQQHPPLVPAETRRARGAGRNMAGRFERFERVEPGTGWEGDGWDIPEPPKAWRTEVAIEAPRSAITRNASPDVPFDRSLNPYRGCEHGCIYCFARPSHGYLGLSPGLDFETRLVARPEIWRILDKELRRPSYVPAPLALGTNTDPYQPIESRFKATRKVLKVLKEFGHPVGIVTKGTMVARDLDILGPMAAQGMAHLGVTITTLDPDLSRRMEPRVPLPARRLALIRQLADAGVPVRVMVSPVIPGLTDHELEAILEAAAAAGARAASWIMLRLPHEVAPLMEDWLQEHVPGRAEKVLRRLREMHDGQLYDSRFGHRMRGQGVHARMIARRFDIAARRLGLSSGLPPLDCGRFAVPLGTQEQPSLF
ncbi:PA0069 family radical SAM protein [Lutimaribacter sp. EGI FJ00015]|uniref:PA0069 family radical SAM protein n=1 Tax=Lutimaribacter degradans TaxID=2945989 RepID=A0ACC5ZS52_9RHOB|nr:PA0069 family radical SAM protein [Lutimaribacter sp. EGI FJ00013]MCM2561142.1 PA0069 family radical SAM protein [Lutimaribacter sp. EGI FJ00013]MCO0611909.1 PA0069 family radical SAM protein [Lutimaribacter sp. EGI FJ00015]MCO0634970.1 PA0069 family radical SAM protein [Lutimaribacter sp. EGI FJ00014]